MSVPVVHSSKWWGISQKPLWFLEKWNDCINTDFVFVMWAEDKINLLFSVLRQSCRLSEKESHYNTHYIILFAYKPNRLGNWDFDKSEQFQYLSWGCCRGEKGKRESWWGGYSRYFILEIRATILDINSSMPQTSGSKHFGESHGLLGGSD